MQVYNNNLTTSIWKNYTANAANLRGSISLLSNGLKSAQASNSTDISLDQALRMKYRQIAATAGETETRINHLQTTDAWMQKTQTILEEISALPQQTDQSAESNIAQIQESFEMMRAELARIQQKNDGQIFMAEGETEPPRWLDLIAQADAHALTDDGAALVASAAQEGRMDLHGKRTTIGDEIGKLELSLIELRSQAANIRATENQINDSETAQATAENAKGAILTQIGTAMLAQANTLPGSVMHLTTPNAG